MINLEKKIAVYGLGISGIATIKYLKKNNLNFIAADDKEETISRIVSNYPELRDNLKNLSDSAWLEIDYLILSPGIALNFPTPHPVVKLARERGVKIICDIELFYQLNKEALFVAITGTNGKSTTASLIYHILRENNLNAYLGGNIGIPVLDIETSGSNKIFVLEISSYQLDLLDEAKFNISILLNITPDHLDRHGSMENYKLAKYRIFKHQTENDCAIINKNLEHLNIKNPIQFSEKEEAEISVIDGIINICGKKYKLPENKSLLGKHNQQNIAASVAAVLKFNLSEEQIIIALKSFSGLKHRMQFIDQHNGVTFINDSKATNAESTANALECYDNIIWLAGGVPKEGGIICLKQYFKKIKFAVFFGKASGEFIDSFADKAKSIECVDLAEAFAHAIKIAKKDDVILLSPSCSSFDQWKNFEERGDAFIKMINQLN